MPELSFLFLSVGKFEAKMYRNNLHALETLKNEVKSVIQMLHNVSCMKCPRISFTGARHVLIWRDTTMSTFFEIQARQNLVFRN